MPEPITTLIGQAAVKSALSLAMKTFFDILKKQAPQGKDSKSVANHKFSADAAAVTRSLNSHQKERLDWCQEINHSGMSKAIPLDSIYISLNVNEHPRGSRLGQAQKSTQAERVFRKKQHTAVIGDLGSGKTTLLKNYAISRWAVNSKSAIIFILIKDLDEDISIIDQICLILNLHFIEDTAIQHGNPAYSSREFQNIRILTLCKLLDSLNVKILADGLDEAPRAVQERTLQELEQLGVGLKSAKIIFSSRPPNLNTSLQKFLVYEIDPLTEPSIQEFVERWFKFHNNEIADQEEFTVSFMRDLKDLPYYDTANRPLILTNLCILFQKYRKLPNDPKVLYSKIINLFLEEWDAERGVNRYTQYSKLEPYNKLQYLANFAYNLMVVSSGYSSFDDRTCELIYQKIREKFDLPLHEFKGVTQDIQSTTGIIIKSSYNEFEFSHKSIFEYLVAEYLVRSGFSAIPFEVLDLCPNECAVAVALSSQPEHWMMGVFVRDGVLAKRDALWARTFCKRLISERIIFVPCDIVAVCTIWLWHCLHRQAGMPEEPEFRKLVENEKVRRALISYFDKYTTGMSSEVGSSNNERISVDHASGSVRIPLVIKDAMVSTTLVADGTGFGKSFGSLLK